MLSRAWFQAGVTLTVMALLPAAAPAQKYRKNKRPFSSSPRMLNSRSPRYRHEILAQLPPPPDHSLSLLPFSGQFQPPGRPMTCRFSCEQRLGLIGPYGVSNRTA